MQALLNFLTWMGFRKPDDPRPPREVTIYGAPGTVVHLAGASGTIYGTVVLVQIEVWGKGGARVEFMDKTRYTAERTIQHDHMSWCTNPMHTVAEGCRP